jgi:hypothetical protein
MSKDKKHSQPALEVLPVTEPAFAPTPIANSTPKMFLAEVDKLALDLAKEQRKTALAEAKTALANNEKAELTFKYIVLQLYMKYGLNERDAISEQGEIIKDGALKQRQQG